MKTVRRARKFKILNRKIKFNPFFEKLAGTKQLRQQIIRGKSECEIRKSWQVKLDEFKLIRKKYLIYPDVK